MKWDTISVCRMTSTISTAERMVPAMDKESWAMAIIWPNGPIVRSVTLLDTTRTNYGEKNALRVSVVVDISLMFFNIDLNSALNRWSFY